MGYTPSLASANSTTISAPLAGTNGFTKSGWGNLILTGGNPLSGTVNVDSGSTTASDGSVQIGAANAGTNLTAINFRNNNSGSSTLQLAGGANVPAAISLSGRNTNVVALENVSGSNTLSGSLAINSGGGYYVFQSDAGTLNLGGIVSSAATGTRNFTFQGAGDFYISGSLQNGSATTVNAIKQDAGNLIFANTNTFTGALGVGGGAAKINFPLALQNTILNLGCAATNALKFGAVGGAIISGLNGLGDVWLTNASLAAATLTNGNNNTSSEYAGVLRGSGNLMKIGSGTFTLDNSNAYTGATSIAGGTLRFGTATNIIASLLPVLWLSFDSVSGTTVTNQGKGGWGMNGTIIGSGAYITNSGKFGNALYVNGVGTNTATNIVMISSKVVDTSVSGSWSLGYWIKTTTAGAVIMYQGDGGWNSGDTTYYLNAGSSSSGGTHAGAVRYAGNWLTGAAALNDGNWHFVTLVDSAGSETIFVDGNSDSTTATMSGALASGANQIWIGGSPDGGDGTLKMTGFIDEVCLFDRALTQAQIRSIITNAPVTGKLPSASAVNVASGSTLNLSGYSQTIASLSDLNGSGGLVTNGGAVPITLTLGSNIGTSTFSGVIAENSAANAVSLVKNGLATETISGANNFRGTTTVNAGTLLINGALGTNTLNVAGGTLGGGGLINGAVTIQPSGTLSPGGGGIGTLTISNALNLNGTTYIELNQAAATNDNLSGLTSVNFGGVLSLVNLAGTLTTNDSFKIFSAASYGGAFTSITPTIPSPGLAWDGSTLTSDGTLRILQTVSLAPMNIGTLINNGTLTLSWPADHIGWRLQTQTNDSFTGLGTNWQDVAGSTLTNQVNVPMDSTLGNVFYRMLFP